MVTPESECTCLDVGCSSEGCDIEDADATLERTAECVLVYAKEERVDADEDVPEESDTGGVVARCCCCGCCCERYGYGSSKRSENSGMGGVENASEGEVTYVMEEPTTDVVFLALPK